MNPLEFGWDVFGDSLWSAMSPPDISVANDDNIRLISCNCNAACRSVQCSCSKAELCCTKVCWYKGDMNCVNPSTISTHDQDSLLIRKTMKRTLAELNKTQNKLATLITWTIINMSQLLLFSWFILCWWPFWLFRLPPWLWFWNSNVKKLLWN